MPILTDFICRRKRYGGLRLVCHWFASLHSLCRTQRPTSHRFYASFSSDEWFNACAVQCGPFRISFLCYYPWRGYWIWVSNCEVHVGVTDVFGTAMFWFEILNASGLGMVCEKFCTLDVYVQRWTNCINWVFGSVHYPCLGLSLIHCRMWWMYVLRSAGIMFGLFALSYA